MACQKLRGDSRWIASCWSAAQAPYYQLAQNNFSGKQYFEYCEPGILMNTVKLHAENTAHELD
jgi:hypothetical protein